MKKILIVEDDPFIRDLTTLKFVEKEYQIVTASSVETALEQIETQHCDVILLDLDLPDSKGIETFNSVYPVALKTSAKIIIFSNNADEEVQQKTLAGGAVGFFVKAETNFEDLYKFIEKL